MRRWRLVAAAAASVAAGVVAAFVAISATFGSAANNGAAPIFVSSPRATASTPAPATAAPRTTSGRATPLAANGRLLDRLKISYANWTFSDIDESSAALKPGTCSGSTYAGTGVLTESGAFIRSRIRTADDF